MNDVSAFPNHQEYIYFSLLKNKSKKNSLPLSIITTDNIRTTIYKKKKKKIQTVLEKKVSSNLAIRRHTCRIIYTTYGKRILEHGLWSDLPQTSNYYITNEKKKSSPKLFLYFFFARFFFSLSIHLMCVPRFLYI